MPRTQNYGQALVTWVRQMIASLDQHQTRQLHFRELSPAKKSSIARQLASLEVRIFTFISHKKNMQGYRNIHAEKAKVNKTAWFYVWCTKVLLESVTDYCANRADRDNACSKIIRFEFSATGGVRLDDVRSYYRYIKEQATLGLSFKKDFPLCWEAIDPEQMFIYPNADRYGLQLADIAASAFYTGLEYPPLGQLDAQYAEILAPRICLDRKRRKRFMYGVKFMPRTVGLRLPPEQRGIWDFYQNK